MKIKIGIQNLLPEQKNSVPPGKDVISLPDGSEIEGRIVNRERESQERLTRDLNFRFGGKGPLPDPEASYTGEEKALAAWKQASDRERSAILKKEAQRRAGISRALKNIKSSSVGGKNISEINIALALSILDNEDIKTLNKSSGNTNDYSSTVQAIVKKAYSGPLNILLADTGIMAIESFLGLIAGAGLTAATMASGTSGIGATVWAFGTASAMAFGALLASKIAIGIGLTAAVFAYYSEGRLDEIDKSEIESVLMDLQPLFNKAQPYSEGALLRILQAADPEFMKAPGSERKDFEDFYDNIQSAVVKIGYNPRAKQNLGYPSTRDLEDVRDHLKIAYDIFKKYLEQQKGPSRLFKGFDELARQPGKGVRSAIFSKDLIYALEYIRKFIRAPGGAIHLLPNKGEGRAWLGKKARGVENIEIDFLAKMMFSGFNAVKDHLDRDPSGNLSKKPLAGGFEAAVHDLQEFKETK